MDKECSNEELTTTCKTCDHFGTDKCFYPYTTAFGEYEICDGYERKDARGVRKDLA
jgi:hypothetical protein